MFKASTTLLRQAVNSNRLIINQQAQMFSSTAGLNQFYIPNKPEPVKFNPKSNKPKGMSSNHRSAPWKLDEIMKSTEEHVVYTWGATDPSRKAAMPIQRGEGVFLYDYNGNKYYDMTSQAINNNLGYGIPKPILDAITN